MKTSRIPKQAMEYKSLGQRDPGHPRKKGETKYTYRVL
jgi:hypothetical protein